jgi:ankyrin repeat protein
MDAGVNLNSRTAGRQSMLHFAAQGGSLQVLRRMLDLGAPADDVDADGNTPLHCGAERGHLEVRARGS